MPDNPEPLNKPRNVNKNLVLVLALLVGNLGAFMTSSLNVALPAINQEFQPDVITLNWVITAFVLSWAIFSLPSGRLADIFGLRRFSIYGAIIFFVSTVAAIFSNSIQLLIALRAIQGIGAAILGSTMMAIITITFPAQERGKALGIFISSVYAWLSIGPFLGGILTQYFDWRSLFIFSAPFGLAIAIIFIWVFKAEWIGAKGEKFDYVGSLFFAVALVALIYGFSEIKTAAGMVITAAGVAALVLFFYWENRASSPLLAVREFKSNRTFVFSNLASLITYCATAAIAYLLSLYLQIVKGYSPFYASLILIIQPVVQTVLAPITGKLSDKIQPRLVASGGMALIFIGLVSLVFLSENSSLIQVIITLFVIGFGFGLFVPPNTNAIMSSVTPKHYAVASSLTSTMRTIGQTLSMGITLIVTALIVGDIVLTQENHPGFMTVVQVSFGIFAFLCLLGIFASLARNKRPAPGEQGLPPDSSKPSEPLQN
jgi:EmrB/QacA subfamily drug resistance transporter